MLGVLVTGAEVTFVRGEDGAVRELVLLHGGHETRASRVAAEGGGS